MDTITIPADKYRSLTEAIRERGSMLVAFSGGTDSALLSVLANDLLGERSGCALVDSPLVPRGAVASAHALASDFGLTLGIIPSEILTDPEFSSNPPGRCFTCKKDAARLLCNRAVALGFSCVADGANVTDTREYRPGLAACDKAGIIHPYIEAGLTKGEIRLLARHRGIPDWAKPSESCLATRIPYGEPVTEEKLKMISDAEKYLKGLGVPHCRVRLHNSIARIEADGEGMGIIFSRRGEVDGIFHKLGIPYTTLDLRGYRSGSMDETL